MSRCRPASSTESVNERVDYGHSVTLGDSWLIVGDATMQLKETLHCSSDPLDGRVQGCNHFRRSLPMQLDIGDRNKMSHRIDHRGGKLGLLSREPVEKFQPDSIQI